MKKVLIILSIVVLALTLTKKENVIIPKNSIRFRVIANSNMSDYLSSMQQVAQTLADIWLGQDSGQDPDYQKVRDIYIRDTIVDHLPIIDWKAAQERLENAKMEVIKQKKIKDNMENPDNNTDAQLDDSLLDEGDELL